MTLIGTAGWSIPARFTEKFPSAGSHLERYARVFSAVEINSSFYRPHRRATYERWSASVPAEFRFSVKIPKAISHERRLVDVIDLLDAFVDEVSGLGEKLAVVLLQLPPSFVLQQDNALAFFDALGERLSRAVAIACEPRHATWFAPDADTLLNDCQVARVAADPKLHPDAGRPGGWLGLRYHRLHGNPRVYYSLYGLPQLEILAQTLAAKNARPLKSWCVFDNTAAGAATGNAMTLTALLSDWQHK